MSSPPVLRPLGVREILGAALIVYRQHAPAMWRVVAVVVALPAALNGALAVAERQVRDSDGSSGSLVILQSLVLVVSLVASCLATAATFRLVVDAYLGRPIDPGASMRFALQRLSSVIWVSVIVGLGVSIGTLLLVVPGVYLFVAWSVAVPVLLSENLRGVAALRRSRELVRGRWWSCAGVLVLAFLMAIVVAAVILIALTGILGSNGSDTALFFEQGISSLIANTLVLPLWVGATAVLYIDLRVRKEEFSAQALTHSLSPGGT